MELQKAPNRRALIPLRIEVIVKKVRRRKWFSVGFQSPKGEKRNYTFSDLELREGRKAPRKIYWKSIVLRKMVIE